MVCLPKDCQSVTHLPTNRCQRRATSLMETNALPPRQTANRVEEGHGQIHCRFVQSALSRTHCVQSWHQLSQTFGTDNVHDRIIRGKLRCQHQHHHIYFTVTRTMELTYHTNTSKLLTGHAPPPPLSAVNRPCLCGLQSDATGRQSATH